MARAVVATRGFLASRLEPHRPSHVTAAKQEVRESRRGGATEKTKKQSHDGREDDDSDDFFLRRD